MMSLLLTFPRSLLADIDMLDEADGTVMPVASVLAIEEMVFLEYQANIDTANQAAVRVEKFVSKHEKELAAKQGIKRPLPPPVKVPDKLAAEEDERIDAREHPERYSNEQISAINERLERFCGEDINKYVKLYVMNTSERAHVHYKRHHRVSIFKDESKTPDN